VSSYFILPLSPALFVTRFLPSSFFLLPSFFLRRFFLQEGECRVREHETYLNPDVSASERDGTRLGALAAQIGPASAVMVRDDSDVFQNRKKYDFVSGDYFMEHAVFIPDGSHCRAQVHSAPTSPVAHSTCISLYSPASCCTAPAHSIPPPPHPM
jgi:hypothetical protein